MTANTIETPDVVEAPASTHLQLLQATVAAKTAYWDALLALEHALGNGEDLSDRDNDRLAETIADLAAGIDAVEDVPTMIGEEELAALMGSLKFD